MIDFATNVFISTDELVFQCGAVATHKESAPEDAVSAADAQRYATFKPEDSVIFVAPYMLKILKPCELSAILAHEQGHIDLGHLEKHKGVKGVVDDMEIELEADAYAAKKCGAKVMRAALGKTLSGIIGELADRYEIPENVKFKIYRDAVRKLKPRLSAIRAAM